MNRQKCINRIPIDFTGGILLFISGNCNNLIYNFRVPYNVEEILTANYGDKIKCSTPREMFDYLNNVDWLNGIERSELDLPYTIRYFHKNGSIDVQRTLFETNIYFAKINKTLLTLPNDDEKFL